MALKAKEKKNQASIDKNKLANSKNVRTLGPISDLEKHLPSDWWNSLFNSLYLKTDGDVVENHANTTADVDLLISAASITKSDSLLDVCCGQGRHTLELARRGFTNIAGIDRSRYLIRLARKRAQNEGLAVQFSEGDARKIRLAESSKDCVFLLGNSFGYFEREEDDVQVLSTIQKILKSNGRLVLDIVDGTWMTKNFEPRSWEWIDQQHFVNRERSLSASGKKIITREIITHSERGVIADQFYAERLYELNEIAKILTDIGYNNVVDYATIKSHSTRGQDLGMMSHRMFITCNAPIKKTHFLPKQKIQEITIIFGDPGLPDKVKKNGKFNEEDFETTRKLKEAVEKIGNYKIIYIDDHKTLLQQLIKKSPDFVLNLCDEGLRNDATLELHIPALLEILGIPYSGSAPGCLALCYDKSKVRAIASASEIPVPLETFYNPGDQAANIPAVFPSLIKPASGDSSIGITQNAVVHNASELVEYLTYLKKTMPNIPILIQEFLQGTEYSVGLIGNNNNIEVLPVLEVDYSQLPENLPKILSYESKWLPESPYWDKIIYKEAEISDDFRNQLTYYSKKLFERLDCRDYARFDFRCDAAGEIKLLEVNPNPGWCWDGKLNLMAGFSGIAYHEMIDMIIKAALERIRDNAR